MQRHDFLLYLRKQQECLDLQQEVVDAIAHYHVKSPPLGSIIAGSQINESNPRLQLSQKGDILGCGPLPDEWIHVDAQVLRNLHDVL